MTSTNDGKEAQNNQTSGTKGKTYLIELYKSLEARLSETAEPSERTKHLCSAWRAVHSLCQHSAPSTHNHLQNWLHRHTARTVLQTSWQKPEREDDRRSLEAAINDFIATASASANVGQTQWELAVTSRGEWFKRVSESPWQHPVLDSLLNASASPPTDDEVLTWLKEERGLTFVVRLYTLVGAKCDDIALSLATAVMDRARAGLPPVNDAVDQGPSPAQTASSFGDKLREEAEFTQEVWDSITDIEFVLLHKRDRDRCIALAKQTQLSCAYWLIERLQKRLQAEPREERLWKNARKVAILIAQVVIARCMVVQVCQGEAHKALYCCTKLLAGLLTSELAGAADALARTAPTARHLHTMAAAVDKQLSAEHQDMKPYVCELYVRALTAGMNELERLKLKTEKEAEARTMERTLASWFVQLGSVLSRSDRIACECTLTAFSLQPSQRMYERIEAAPRLAPLLTDKVKDEPITSEFGSWANDSRSQTNLVKTSETLNLKQTQNQTNVLSSAIFNEGEALGLSATLCQDIAVLLAGPRVKTLSWDMDRTLLLDNCRSYMEKTHGGTRLPTRELKYLNIDLKQYQHLPEERDEDENDPYYGIERGYEHLAVLEEPEDIWADASPNKSESASSIEDDYLVPRRKKKTKRIPIESSSDDDSGPLSVVAEAKRAQKKKERPHSKERSKERAKKKQEPVDPLGPDEVKIEKPPKEKKERKKKEKAPKVLGGKRNSLAKLLGLRVGKTKKRHKDFIPVATPVTDSDYDSQGKNSVTSLNSEGTEHDALEESSSRRTFTITTSKPNPPLRPLFLPKMQYRPQNPNSPRPHSSITRPSTPDGKTIFSNYKSSDNVRANLSELLEYRRQKVLRMKLEAQQMATQRMPAIIKPNIPPLQAHISPKAVAIPEIPKSYISKEQAERVAEMMRTQNPKDSVIQYTRNAANTHTAPPSTDLRNKPQHPAQSSAIPLKMTDIVNTSYDRLLAEIAERQSKSQEAKPPQAHHQPPPSPLPAHRSYNIMTPGQRDFQNFLQNYERKSVLPHPEDLKPKKPMPTSRVVPVVPSVHKVEPKPVQSAKQAIQQKKPEATLNTFSRLSYMHKNKQNEMKNKASVLKPCATATYQDVSTELDEIIKEHQRAQRRVIQATREKEFAKQAQGLSSKCDSSTHPLLSHMLSSNSNIQKIESPYRSNQIPQTLPSKSLTHSAVLTNSVSAPTPTTNSALSEKDQNDIWSLLKQQNKMNNISQYSSHMHSKSSTSSVTKPQSMTQNNTIGQNQQQLYRPSETPVLEAKCESSLENKIMNVLSNTHLKSGSHVVSKGLSISIKNPSTQKSSENLISTVGAYDKINKNTSNKVIVEKLPEAEKPEWQSVMQDILKLKTPNRESKFIDVPLQKSSSVESSFEKSLKRPNTMSTQPKHEGDASTKHQNKVDRPKPVITSVQNVIITKKGIKLQDAPHPRISSHLAMNVKSKKLTNEPEKKLCQEAQRKQFTYSGPKHTDPFISGIPNSGLTDDLLDELMDDDLREEIDELFADEETNDSYNAAEKAYLDRTKSNENKRVSIQYNKCVNEAPQPKPVTNVHCPSNRQSSSARPLITVQPVSQCANNMTSMTYENNQQKTFSMESILAAQSASRQYPASTASENQVYNVPNATSSGLMNPNNVYISAVPQQAPIQNVVLVKPVYRGYSTVQTPVQTITNLASNYVAVNNTPMALYQTRYATPVAMGTSVSVPVINQAYTALPVVQTTQNTTVNIEPETSMAVNQVNVNMSNAKDTAAVTDNLNRAADYPEHNHKLQDESKATERKVLSEVKDFTTTEKVDNTWNQMIENDMSENADNDMTIDKERLKNKRLAILNREISHRCGEKTIPLSYTPLPKTETVLRPDITKTIGVSKDDKLAEKISDTEEEKLLTQIKNDLQNLSDAINEVSSPATPDSTESKENKSIPKVACRRILLRSSNKVTPKTNIKADDTTVTKKSKVMTKVDNTETQIKDETQRGPDNVKKAIKPDQVVKRKKAPTKIKEPKPKPVENELEKSEVTPTRVSKRIQNKKSTVVSEKSKNIVEKFLPVIKSTEIKADTSDTQYLDIESELKGTLISKSEAITKRFSIEKYKNKTSAKEMTDETVVEKIVVQNVVKPTDDVKIDKESDEIDHNVPEQTPDVKTICVNHEAEQSIQQENNEVKNIDISVNQTAEKTTEAVTTNIPVSIEESIEIKSEVEPVSISPEPTISKQQHIINDNKPISQIDVKIEQIKEAASLNKEFIDKICEKTNEKESSVLRIDIAKYTSPVSDTTPKLTYDDAETATSNNKSVIKTKAEDSVMIAEEIPKVAELETKKTEEVSELPKKLNDIKTGEIITIPKTPIIEVEPKTAIQKDDIDLDMSVTCDESTCKPSPILGSVITARNKSINSGKKKVIETRDKPIDTEKEDLKILETSRKYKNTQNTKEAESVSDDVVVINDDNEKPTQKLEESDKTVRSDMETEPCIETVSLEPTPEKWLKNPDPQVIPKVGILKADTSTKQQETSKIQSLTDDDDVVIIDENCTTEPKLPPINNESNKSVTKTANNRSLLKNSSAVPAHVEPALAKHKHEKVSDKTTVIKTSTLKFDNKTKSPVRVANAKNQEAQQGKSSESARTPSSHDIPLDFKDKIRIEELPCDEPNKKKIRVFLPNGKKFKATVHGNINFTYETLFTYPAIKNVLLNGLDCKKLLATVDIMNPEKILSAEVLNVKNEPVAVQKSLPVETIDLLSDEEDSGPTINQPKPVEEFVFVIETELGKLTVPPMDKDLFLKQKAQLKQKSQILLQKVDEKIKGYKRASHVVDKNYKTSLMLKNTDRNPDQITQNHPTVNIFESKPLISAQPPIIPSHYLAGLINDIDTKLTAETKNTPKVIPEVVEIDDSSNDSLDLNKSDGNKPEDKTIDLLKNSLLKELGVEVGSKVAVNNVQEELSSDDDDVQIIENSDENVVKETPPAKKRNRGTVLKLSAIPKGKSCRLSNLDEEEQQKIKRQKCAIKLIRCDDLSKIHEKELNAAENKFRAATSESETVVLSEELSILDSIGENIADDRCSSPVIEFFDVLVALDTNIAEDKSVKIMPLSCQASWLSTKLELHCKSNDVVTVKTTESKKYIHNNIKPISYEVNWFNKSATHAQNLHNKCSNDRVEEENPDITMIENKPVTYEADRFAAEPSLYLSGIDNTKSRLELPEYDQKMRDFSIADTTASLVCEASWLADKSLTRLEIQNTRTISSHALDNDIEMPDAKASDKSEDTIPLTCDANWLATKSTIHSQKSMVDWRQECGNDCDSPTINEVIPLICEANWLFTKSSLRLRTDEFIKSNAVHHSNENSEDYVLKVIPLSCNAYWFATKAEIRLQLVEIVKRNNEDETSKKNYDKITPLLCQAKWVSTKATLHLESLNDVLSLHAKYFNNNRTLQKNYASSLTSQALQILQDAKVFDQYRLLQEIITQSNAITLKRRLPSVKKPAVCKVRKLSDVALETTLIDCSSATIDTCTSDVSNVSNSILEDMTIATAVDVDETLSKTPESTHNENTNADNSSILDVCENHKDLQIVYTETNTSVFDCDEANSYPEPELQLCRKNEILIENTSESRSSSPILDTAGLLAFEYSIPPALAESELRCAETTSTEEAKKIVVNNVKAKDTQHLDDSIVTCTTADTNISSCASPKTDNFTNIKENTNEIELLSNFDVIEANMADIFGECLSDDISNITKNTELGKESDINEIYSPKELVNITKKEYIDNQDDNVNHNKKVCNDIEANLADMVLEENIDKNIERPDLIETKVIDDWDTKILETSLKNDYVEHTEEDSKTDNQADKIHTEEKLECAENSAICIEDSVAKLDNMYSLGNGIQPMFENKDDHVIIYVPTEDILFPDCDTVLEEEIVDMQNDEIIDNFYFANSIAQDAPEIQDKEHELPKLVENPTQINKESNTHGFDSIEVKLAELLGEPLINNDLNEIKNSNSHKRIFSTSPDIDDVASQLGESQDCMSHVKKKIKLKGYVKSEDVDFESILVQVPERTYAKSSSAIVTRRRSLKRKMDMSDTKTISKKYRKGKNIDCPKFTALSLTETVYTKEFKKLIDYYTSVKLSYSLPLNKENFFDDHAQLKSWSILNTQTEIKVEHVESNEALFAETEKSEALLHPLKQTLAEEINSEFDVNSYTPSNIQEINFSMGFGERSGRVIQESIDGEYTTFSAATLSDVKQLQPLLPSDEKETLMKHSFADNLDQKLKQKRFVDHLNLREKVRAFFEKSRAELNWDLKQNQKKHGFENDADISSWPFGDLTSTRCFRPSPVDVTVNVVQVGQLPVSAAAQNPVTCDPRVTHVSNASPSQCSPENSIGDELQTPIKTEYTELTTADINLPMMQQYVTQHHSMPSDSQEPTNAYNANSSINAPPDMKSVIKIELMEETSEDHEDDNLSYDNSGQLPNGNIGSNIQYQFENVTSNMMAESSSNTQAPNSSIMPKAGETFSDNKQSSDAVDKSDQLAHAMNAAGIPANRGLAKPSNIETMPQNPQPNVAISQANTNFTKTTPINAIALQQALAQILPPSLNQANASDNNSQTSGNPQVLHIVQGNNSQSVINKSNGTQLLHIVQNKTAGNGSGAHTPQQNTFSGLSLVDGTLQQGGNQLLHIVNAANQKNANAGQLLKRVNLLTNLANVQGSNEQKMVQFVCKSADGKPIQLPHQRSMVLRLQPLDPSTVPTTPKQNDNQDHASSSGKSHPSAINEKETSPQEMKSRSLYEENYAKFVQNDTKFTQNGDQKQGQEKATSLPKFNQVFGKQVYQDKQEELETENMPQNPEPPEDNNPPLEQINDITNPQMLIRKPNQNQPHVQPNLVQQIKQTIGPMNIQTMHGGVIYTRQIPVNIGNGQTINLITVPSTELVDDSAQKQQNDGKFGNQEGDPPIIKIVPTNQATSANGSTDENNGQLKGTEGNPQPTPQPNPQPVLTQMRIKLPMLSKAPQMLGGTRVMRPSFFQIQRNVIGGANQQVYQQLVLTAAPPIGQSIRLPAQVQKPKIPSETQSSPESQMSSSTLEQLREFDMVLEQVKERSTVQPGTSTTTNNFSKLKGSPDTTDAPTPSTSTQESPTQVLYSVGNSQTLNMVNYVTRKSTITSTTTSSFVRSPDSTGTVESPSSSTHSLLPHTVTSDSCASSCASEAAASTASQPKPKKKKPKPSTSNSNPFNIKNTPKPSSQKPLEDEQTTQRILYILAEYKEQVENSPDKDKPAPRRRNNPAAPNSGSSKRKKSSSGSRRRDMSPVLGEDSCRTMGSEDSSCGTSLGECNECLETHSPEESPKKVVRRLTFEQETQITQTRTTTTTTTVPQRNVIVTDGQAFAVRGATGKPATTVLMPANYLLPVSMVKGGQQIAIVTNRGPKLLVGAGEGGTGGALLFQRLIGPGGLKPVIARPGVRHIRLPTAALHNLQAFNIATPATVPPPDSTASPAPAPTPPDLVDTRAMSSPWPDRDAGEIKPERGNSSPEGSEPWNLPSSSIADDYGYEEIVRTDNMDRTVLDAIPDRYSPDLEAQRIFDKMFDSDSKKSMYDSRYDIDASDDDKAYQQVVHRKDGRHTTRLTHVSAAALRHKYAILEHELRLQKSLSEECEDLGVDSPSASELFPEAELLFAPSPAHEQTIDQCHTPQPMHTQGIPQPDLDDQIATDQLLTHKERPDDLDINLDDVGEIVTVGEDGMTTIPLDHEEFARSHEEFARSHPNTTFHSEPEAGEVPPFTIAQGVKGRQITFHSRGVPGTVVMAPQTTVISQATVEAAGSQSTVKFSDIDNMINAMPSPQHAHNLNMPSVLVKDGNESLTKFDRLLHESRDMSPNMTSNPASVVHSAGNGTQVIRRVQYENRRDSRYLVEDSDAMIGGDSKVTEERRDLPMDENSSERHPELFWEQSRSERKRFDFSSDSDKCCKSPYDENNSDSSGVGAHTRLDSVIKAARPERRRSDGSSAEESHPPLRTYPAKRSHQHAHHSHHDVDRSLTGKTRAPDRCHDVKDESKRRASNRGVVKRGCHCCNGSSTAPKPKKSRPKKSNEYPHN